MSGCPVCEEGEVDVEGSDREPDAATVLCPAERAADVRAQAERLLARYNVTEPPVDVERIAVDDGLRVVRRHLDKGDGFLEDGILTVNARHARTRQRFTIAHELGHLVLHADGTDDDSEREADQFASALLIPRNMLRRAVAEARDLEVLRRRFNVSREAMWIAVKDAGLERRVANA